MSYSIVPEPGPDPWLALHAYKRRMAEVVAFFEAHKRQRRLWIIRYLGVWR